MTIAATPAKSDYQTGLRAGFFPTPPQVGKYPFNVSSSACAAFDSGRCPAWIAPTHFSIGGSLSGMHTAPSEVICVLHSAGTALPPSPLATILPTVTSWWLSSATSS